MISTNSGSFKEAVAVAVLGGVFGAAVGGPLGVAVPFGMVAASNGAISGWRRTYDWSCSSGLVAFTLDSTWALPMTAAAMFSHAVGAVSKKSAYVVDLSRRQNRHVYQRGFMPRRGFAITVGNVVSGAGDTSLPPRQRLVTDHEDVHIWQARWFGPFYPLLYGGWMLCGGAIGATVWAVSRRSDRFTKVVESCAYYLNPFEWWAYSRAGHWPPSGKVAGLGWRRPITRPLR